MESKLNNEFHRHGAIPESPSLRSMFIECHDSGRVKANFVPNDRQGKRGWVLTAPIFLIIRCGWCLEPEGLCEDSDSSAPKPPRGTPSGPFGPKEKWTDGPGTDGMPLGGGILPFSIFVVSCQLYKTPPQSAACKSGYFYYKEVPNTTATFFLFHEQSIIEKLENTL